MKTFVNQDKFGEGDINIHLIHQDLKEEFDDILFDVDMFVEF